LLGARLARPAAIVRERGRRGRETQCSDDKKRQDTPGFVLFLPQFRCIPLLHAPPSAV